MTTSVLYKIQPSIKWLSVSGPPPPIPPDAIPPIITYVTPNTSDLNKDDPIVVEVTDNLGDIRRIFLQVHFLETGDVECVHDGDEFSPRYVSLSTIEVIANGFRYTLKRKLGWPQIVGRQSLMRWKTHAIDTAGNEA